MGRRRSRRDHTLSPPRAATRAVRDRLSPRPTMDIDASAARVELLQGPPLRRDVEGLLDAYGSARGHDTDAALLVVVQPPAWAGRALNTGEEPERGMGC